MKRFLFAVPPFAGHVLPTVSVGRALKARGHQVLWVGLSEIRRLLPEDAELVALDADASPESRSVEIEKVASRGWESLQVLWEGALVPLARGMFEGVGRAIAQYEPDVVIADQQAIGGALAARRAGVPWATFCTTSASVMDALVDLPKVKQWVVNQLAMLEREAGLPPDPAPDTSPSLVVVFSTRALVGEDRSWPEHYHFVGPSIQDRPDPTPFPWDWLNTRPRIFASLGTIGSDSPGNARFLSAAIAALHDLPCQLVIAAPKGVEGEIPEHVLVRERVPQVALLREMDAVITHGGHNTVCEALAHGLPLVVAPIRHDQPAVAAQVVRAGAAVRVRYGRVTPQALRSAVEQVLGEASFRASAQRIGASFARAGGAAAAADALENLS
ncbi:MAG: glycosyltransferase [Myxococcales bacterium]